MGCFRDNLVGNLIHPDDDFAQRVRKWIVAILFFPSSVLWLANTIAKIFVMTTTWQLMGLIPMIFIIIAGITSYIQLRRKKHVTGIHMAATLWTIHVFYCFYSFSSINEDHLTPMAIVVSIAIVTQMPGIPAFMVYTFLMCGVLHWNRDAFTRDRSMLLQFPDATQNRSVGGWIGTSVGLGVYATVVGLLVTFVLFLCFWIYHKQAKEAAAKHRSQLAASMMTRRVLESQKRYDTDEVGHILDECDEENIVDPELMTLFREMNSNNRRYRPFLPNYLFLGGDTDAMSVISDAPVLPYDGMYLTFSEGGEDRSSTGSEEDRKSPKTPDSSSGGVDKRRFEVTSPVARTTRSSEGTASQNGSKPATPLVTSPMVNFGAEVAATSYLGVISMAWIELQCSEWFSSQRVKRNSLQPERSSQRYQRQTQALPVFTDALFDLAQATKASVHSLVGDTVQLSWNATHRVPQAELKASLFLLRIRQAIATALPTLKVAGAACSGKAEVHNTISLGTRQQAMYVDTAWLPALHACYTLAKRYKTLIVDANTEAGSHQQVILQGVDCIRYVPQVATDPQTGAAVSEVPSGILADASFAPQGFPLTAPESFDTLLGVNGPQQEETAKPPLLDRNLLRYTLAFELLKRKSESIHDEDEWLYSGGEKGDVAKGHEVDKMVTNALMMVCDGAAARAGKFVVEHDLEGAVSSKTGADGAGPDRTEAPNDEPEFATSAGALGEPGGAANPTRNKEVNPLIRRLAAFCQKT